MFPNTMSGMKLVPGTQRGLYEAIGISWSRTGNQAPKWTISCSEYGENHVLRSLSCESPTDLAYLEGQVRAVRTPMNQSTGKIKVQVGPLGGSPR